MSNADLRVAAQFFDAPLDAETFLSYCSQFQQLGFLSQRMQAVFEVWFNWAKNQGIPQDTLLGGLRAMQKNAWDYYNWAKQRNDNNEVLQLQGVIRFLSYLTFELLVNQAPPLRTA